MDPPSGRVPKQGPDWFLVATEACGGGTPDLRSVVEVWAYISGVGIENKLGESTRGPQGQRARPRGWARRPPLWLGCGPPAIDSFANIFY